MARNSKKYSAHVADEVASAEANLRAAQERLAAARERCAQAQAHIDSAQTSEDTLTLHPEESPDGSTTFAPDDTSAQWEAPAPTYIAPTKDHIAAGVLAILFGALGIHKFYMGLPNAGFITLGISVIGGIVSFGSAAFVMQLIGIVEGIIYLVKSQDDFEKTYITGRRSWF